MSEQDTVTFEEAVELLPDGDDIHTFRNPAGMLIGADWRRDSLLAALEEAPEILVTGEQAQAMHHGLAIMHAGSVLFIETKRHES